MTKAEYVDQFNNLLDMAYEFKVQLHDQDVIYIVTEEKYTWGGYDINIPYEK